MQSAIVPAGLAGNYWLAVEMDSANQVSAVVDGQAWSQQPFPYQAKCLGWLRQAHEDLPPTARAQADAALGPAGLSGLFA